MNRKRSSLSPPPFTQKKRNIKTFNITVLIKTQRLLVKSQLKNTGNLDQQAKHEK